MKISKVDSVKREDGSVDPTFDNQIIISDIVGNLRIVPYGRGNIGINLCETNGNTIRQIGYFDRETNKWKVNDGTQIGAETELK